MSESATRTRIAHMLGEINGIVTPFVNIPRRLQDAQLPASVVFPGRATHSKTDLGEQLIAENRIYKIVLYINNAEFGAAGQTEIQADPFFDTVIQHFAARPGLELDSEGANQTYSVLTTALLGDSGLTVGSYPLAGQGGDEYIQISFDLQVQEIIEIVYHD